MGLLVQFSDPAQPDVELRRAAVHSMANLCLRCIQALTGGEVDAFDDVRLTTQTAGLLCARNSKCGTCKLHMHTFEI